MRSLLLGVALIGLLLALPFMVAQAVDRADKDLIPFGDDDTLEEIRYKIEHNGYLFTVADNWVYSMPAEEKAAFFSRYHPLRPMPKSQDDP
nr:hypothetical protein [bacterium]